MAKSEKTNLALFATRGRRAIIERFVGGLKSAGVEFSAGETDDGNQLLHHSYSTNVV